MRALSALAPVSLIALSLACGPSTLTRREAERDIAQDYPVQVTATLPAQASAIKGSPEHAKLVALQQAVSNPLTFTVQRTSSGDMETFLFQPVPALANQIQSTPAGFVLPAAHAEFVRCTKLEPGATQAKFTYQIRLSRPGPYFSVFQKLFPKAQVGSTQDRHATYVREGRKWILNGTDERYKKVQ